MSSFVITMLLVGLPCLHHTANKGLSSTQAAPTVVTHSAHMEVAADIDDSSHVLAENAADVVQPHTHPKQESDVHMMMGAALVAGFVVMLLIDQLWKHSHSHSQHGPGGELYSLSSLHWVVSDPMGLVTPSVGTPHVLCSLGNKLHDRYMHLFASPLDFRWRDNCAQAKEAHSHYWSTGTRGW